MAFGREGPVDFWVTPFAVTAVQKIAEILPPTGPFCCRDAEPRKGQTPEGKDKRGRHYPKLLRILERTTSVMCVLAIAQPSGDVPHAMQDAPDVNVIVALDVEDHVRIAL